MEDVAAYWKKSQANEARVAALKRVAPRVDLFRRQSAAEPERVTILKVQPGLAPPTPAERARSAASREMARERVLALVKDAMRTRGLSQAGAEAVVRGTPEGAALWEQAGYSRLNAAEPRPASGALTKRDVADGELEALAQSRGVSRTDLILTALGSPTKHQDVIKLLAARQAPDKHLTVEQIAAAGRDNSAILRKQLAREAAGEPADFDAAVKLIGKRDGIGPTNAMRAASEHPELYREWAGH
jgi:hypothetical protein